MTRTGATPAVWMSRACCSSNVSSKLPSLAVLTRCPSGLSGASSNEGLSDTTRCSAHSSESLLRITRFRGGTIDAPCVPEVGSPGSCFSTGNDSSRSRWRRPERANPEPSCAVSLGSPPSVLAPTIPHCGRHCALWRHHRHCSLSCSEAHFGAAKRELRLYARRARGWRPAGSVLGLQLADIQTWGDLRYPF